MIDIAPKALRYARLAAEQQSEFACDPEISAIRQQEDAFRQGLIGDRRAQYIEISERTASFCVRVMRALLAQPRNFESSEWDGNDLLFVEAVSASLQQQLVQPKALSL